MQWIINNIEWIFSGIGVFVITGIISLFIRKKNNGKSIKMKQRSGSHSSNIQIGGDYDGRKNETRIRR